MKAVTGSHTFRWEADLSESFHEHVEPRLWSRQPLGTWVSTMESTCSEGRADIVWGRFGPEYCPTQIAPYAEVFRNLTASRILAFVLRHRAAQTQDALLKCTGVSLPVLRKWIGELRFHELLIETKDQRFTAGQLARTLPMVEICSFELKLKNWQRALYQATRYRSFSHRVFVVMPEDGAAAAFENRSSFIKANVGLISHSKTGHSEVLVRPSKRKPHATYRTIMALGMLGDESNHKLAICRNV